MNSFENSIARMKELYTYGQVKENKSKSNSTLEYSAKAADGKTYGIVKECNHYYIKQAVNGKENIAEGYNYIGGYMNKNNYRYDSYNNALKNFELKLSSINEASVAKVDVSTLDPFKKENIIAEATDKMKEEIARQRQIMYNAGMIMNESCDYAVKGGKACTTSQPEAENGAKGDKQEGSKETKAEPEYKGSHVKLDKKATPFKENPKGSKGITESCDGNSCETDFDEGMNKGQEPSTIGWDIDGQEKVNEDNEKEWDKGLPSSAGVGEADTDHNNNPFNKNINETEELTDELDVEDDEFEDETEGVEDIDDFDIEDEDFDETEDIDDEDIEINDEDMDDDIEDEEIEDTTELEEPEVDENDPESIRKEIERLQSLLNDVEPETEETIETNFEIGDDDYEFDIEGEEEIVDDVDDTTEFEDEDTFDETEEDEVFEEGKKGFMNQIIESVVKSVIKEDELHDFGKHPGYRKKPMTLPQTGEDKNAHGEDINDESVHSEEPFGKQIGDSFPYTKLVDAVTKDVMYQLKHGVKLDNKKKVE